MLSEKARQARNAYKRQWSRMNKDKVKAHQEKYWMKKAREAEELEAAADNEAPEQE